MDDSQAWNVSVVVGEKWRVVARWKGKCPGSLIRRSGFSAPGDKVLRNQTAGSAAGLFRPPKWSTWNPAWISAGMSSSVAIDWQ